MAAFGGIGSNALLQIVVYNLVQSLVGAVLNPYLLALTAEVNTATPLAPLTPAEAAGAVVRNLLTQQEAAAEARKAGIDDHRFGVLVGMSGRPPGPGDLAVALRRGLITEAEYLRGVRQGDLRDEWADTVKALAVAEPSPVAMLQAYLEGQITEGKARELYARLGGAPEYFDVLYNSQGSSPTPLEAVEMARRGVIPWDGTGPDVTSYRQAFLEGPWRNKWSDAFRALADYLPPPRTVTAMYREASITRERATRLLRDNGVPADLMDAFLAAGSSQRTAATRDLAQSTVTTLYREQLIKPAQARDYLLALGYEADEVDLILAIEDVRVAERFKAAAVGRVRTAYTGHRIDRGRALAVLSELDVTGEQATTLLGIWDLERSIDVKALTASDIWNALKLELLTPAEAMARLQGIGYAPADAWLYLSIRAKGPVEGLPRPSADA